METKIKSFRFPLAVDNGLKTWAEENDYRQHVIQLMKQVLLTSPGERLFLPEFGGGVRKLVFEPASDVLRGVVKARITNALSRWLGHRLTVELIDVTFGEATAVLEVTVKYRPAGVPDSRVVKFQRTGQ